MVAEQHSKMKVVVRVRPYNRKELEQNQRCIVKVIDDTSILFDPDEEYDEFFFQGMRQGHRDVTKRINKKLTMEFDRVFDTETTNRQIFEECAVPLIDTVLNGYNCSVFVYGATGAGKTFTMLGSENLPGLTYLTMRALFDKMNEQEELRKFDVGVSYLEVYNEQVMNLLTRSGPLKLREDTNNGVVVSGLVLKPIFNAEELLNLLAIGNANRTQHPTDANAESSRSHAIFQVHIRITDRNTNVKRTVKLSMIDLAGSERAASTKGMGPRFKEGASINKSLLALGNCINKLADGLKHIPYRDSNLTRILKDSLGGNCRTLMVANVSMSSLTYEDTYNTLKYASRAKKIRTTLRQNTIKTNMPKDFYIKKVEDLMTEMEKIKELNKNLETQQKAVTTSCGYNDIELKPYIDRIDKIYATLKKTQNYVLNLQSNIKKMSYRTNLRGEVETYKKILNTLQKDSNVDGGENLLSSVFCYNKRIQRDTDDLARWRSKLKEERRELLKLKKEIKETQYHEILQIYFNCKDMELESSNQNMINHHVTSITSEILAHADRLRRALTLICESANNYRHNSQAMDENTNKEFDNSIDEVQRLLRINAITFQDVDNKHCNLDMPETPIYLNGKRLLDDTSDDEPTNSHYFNGVTPAKRRRSKRLDFGGTDLEFSTLNDSEDGTYSAAAAAAAAASASAADHKESPTTVTTTTSSDNFKMPSTLPNPNETRIITEDKFNSTFNLIPTNTIFESRETKTNLVSNILSDQLVHVASNREKIKNVLLKSRNFTMNGLKKTVATGIQKENKRRSPNMVRKSPRPNAVTTTTTSVGNHASGSFPRHKMPMYGSGNGSGNSNGNGCSSGGSGGGIHSAPKVRINRAAAFRVNKLPISN